MLRLSGDVYASAARHGDIHRSGLILPGEARRAQKGLTELNGIIERGDLLALSSRACPIGPLDPPPADPPRRAPLAQVPLLGKESRRAWLVSRRHLVERRPG